MFSKILIANRGEIACRIIRTARRLHIRTVAVYSEADAKAMHVAMADEARLIGGAAPRESYLSIARILDAALSSGAQAIHPGYGFLSENADFAAACAAAGIVFIGPSAAAIRAIGDKAAAKAIMERAGIPTVPGYHGEAQDTPRFAEEARRLGYPLLIKASAGGGGRGMRLVAEASELAAALDSAKREAESAFGNGRLILEKYLAGPRHVEVQVFGDDRGQIVHLFERDCSAQRRHQKVAEEAPAPRLDDDRRRALGAAAIAAARAVDYVGAGTVEFILQGTDFYFIEMNTRLQVEHPVTEMITGHDLVEWQIRIASGEDLPATQERISCRGHAMEARLYAEDPQRDFAPASGLLRQLRLPASAPDLRIETGVREGDKIPIYYDALLAKLVAFGDDREGARRRLEAALTDVEIAGVAHNRDFLLRLVQHPDFVAGTIDTGFIERHRAALALPLSAAPFAAVAAASLTWLHAEQRSRPAPSPQPKSDLSDFGHVIERPNSDKSEFGWGEGRGEGVTDSREARAPHPTPLPMGEGAGRASRRSIDQNEAWSSPWSLRDGWRLAGEAEYELGWLDAGLERRLKIRFERARLWMTMDESTVAARLLSLRGTELLLEFQSARMQACVRRQGNDFEVAIEGRSWRLHRLDPLARRAGAEDDPARLVAPVHGRVLDVPVSPGSSVKRGQVLMLLECMKLEYRVTAPADGLVEALHYAVGDVVEEGALLLTFVPSAGSG